MPDQPFVIVEVALAQDRMAALMPSRAKGAKAAERLLEHHLA